MAYDLSSNRIQKKTKKEIKERCNIVSGVLEEELEDGKINMVQYINRLFTAMQYPFSNEFRFNIHTWPVLLRMATVYGWTPTHNIEEYFKMDGLIINDTEARLLADAVEKALPDIPNEVIERDNEIDRLHWLIGRQSHIVLRDIILCKNGYYIRRC